MRVPPATIRTSYTVGLLDVPSARLRLSGDELRMLIAAVQARAAELAEAGRQDLAERYARRVHAIRAAMR